MSKRNNLSSGKWLMFLDPTVSMEKFFADIHIPCDSEFLVAEFLNVAGQGDVALSLTEVYQVDPARGLQKNRSGSWSSVTGLTWSALPFHKRRADLQGITVRAAIVADVGTAKYESGSV
jgi:hypothetical protein